MFVEMCISYSFSQSNSLNLMIIKIEYVKCQTGIITEKKLTYYFAVSITVIVSFAHFVITG